MMDDQREPADRFRSPRTVLLGVVGLAVLGGGAFLVTERLTGDAGTVATGTPTGTGTLAAPATTPGTPFPAGSSPSPAGKVGSAPKPSASLSPTPKTLADILRKARSANADAGTQIRRPLPPVNAEPAVAADELTITRSGNLHRDGATLQVVSARRDLTGQRELAWAADQGRAVGAVRCTQNFRFTAGAKASEKPTLLVCWRISANRSVYSIAVTAAGRPSMTASAAAIDRRWSKLG